VLPVFAFKCILKLCLHRKGIIIHANNFVNHLVKNNPAKINLPGEKIMKVIADLAIIPIGVGVSLSKYVAACERVLSEAGLQSQLHANGTNVEGEWDVVFAALKRCHETLHEMGAPRVSTNLRLGTRVDRVQTMQEKIESVEQKL